MRRALVALGAGALLLAAGCGAAGAHAADAPAAGSVSASGSTITVQGEAKVPVPVSTATFTAGAQSDAGTAAQALSDDNAAAQRLIAALEKAGVPKKNLTTQNLSVQPQYAYAQGAPPRLTGYQADDTLQVKVDDASKVGPVIDAASAAGATQIGSVSFGPPDDDALHQQALAAAVDDARQRALAVAKEAHLQLGAVKKVTTQISAPPVRVMGFQAAAARAPAYAPTPIETGNQQVEAQVEVTFGAQ